MSIEYAPQESRGGEWQVWADWASNPREYYRSCIIEALKTSDLPCWLADGASEQDLSEAGFDAKLVRPLLRVLQWWGWVRQGHAQKWYWTGGTTWWEHPGMGMDQGWHALPKLLYRQASERVPGLVEQEVLAGRSETLVNWLIGEVLPVREKTWLDIGAGRGQFSRALHANGAHAVMVDVVFGGNPPPSGVHCIQRNVFERFPDGQYDGISLLRFVESFPENQVRALLETCRQHLKPEGVIVLAGYFDEVSEEARMFALHVALNLPEGRTYQLADLCRLAGSAELVVSRTVREPILGYRAVMLKREPACEPPYHGGDETQSPGAYHHGHEVRQRRALLP